jgi:hypothetical protein
MGTQTGGPRHGQQAADEHDIRIQVDGEAADHLPKK